MHACAHAFATYILCQVAQFGRRPAVRRKQLFAQCGLSAANFNRGMQYLASRGYYKQSATANAEGVLDGNALVFDLDDPSPDKVPRNRISSAVVTPLWPPQLSGET